MGNAPSAHHPPGVATVASDLLPTLDASSEEKSDSASSPTDNNKSEFLGSAGRFNPNISIQALGSGGRQSGAGADDVGVYNIDLTTNQSATTAQTLLGGGGSAPIILSGDALLSSLPKDLTPNAIGGQLVTIGRLWPGSGRMMRSYRILVRVPRIDNAKLKAGGESTSTSDNALSSQAASLPFTIELACKSFIVQSDEGEQPLRLALKDGVAELKRLRSLLSNPQQHPHVLSYARWVVGGQSSVDPSNTARISRPIYLLRQHVHTSLSDRLVSRPFLTIIEKNWITFQLCKALQSLHDANICHGHLTTENVLLTSWNWVLISDVGCQHYKPVTLPDDDPGLWIHWFEGRGGEIDAQSRSGEGLGGHHSGNGEKKCCIAPERFYTPKSNDDEAASSAQLIPTKLTPAMDVFTLGCILIEVFLNGERAMDLGDLMEYRRQGDGSTLPQSLKQKLDKIESSKMRAACRHMLTLDPSARLSPTEYLERLSSSSSSKKKKTSVSSTNTGADESNPGSTHLAPVPHSFEASLYPFMLRLRTQILSPDARIALVACHYGGILKATVGVVDEWGAAYFSRVLGPALRRYENPEFTPDKSKSEEKKEDVIKDISKFSLDELLVETEDLLRQLDSGVFGSNNYDDTANDPPLPKPLTMFDHHYKSSPDTSKQSSTSQASIILLLQVVFSSVGHVQRASSKFVALKMSECWLEFQCPFLISLLVY